MLHVKQCQNLKYKIIPKLYKQEDSETGQRVQHSTDGWTYSSRVTVISQKSQLVFALPKGFYSIQYTTIVLMIFTKVSEELSDIRMARRLLSEKESIEDAVWGQFVLAWIWDNLINIDCTEWDMDTWRQDGFPKVSSSMSLSPPKATCSTTHSLQPYRSQLQNNIKLFKVLSHLIWKTNGTL